MKHHAIVYDGDREAALARARAYVADELGLPLAQNPDVALLRYERMGIDDTRTLKERATQAPLGSAQVFIIACDSIMREAQNALLKLLEEPAANTYLVLAVSSVTGLLPTVRSRLTYGGRCLGELSERAFAEEFLRGTPAERLKQVEPLIRDKDRVRTRAVLDAVEERLYAADTPAVRAALKDVAFVRQYAADRSSSLKMLLEHLAVVLPVLPDRAEQH